MDFLDHLDDDLIHGDNLKADDQSPSEDAPDEKEKDASQNSTACVHNSGEFDDEEEKWISNNREKNTPSGGVKETTPKSWWNTIVRAVPLNRLVWAKGVWKGVNCFFPAILLDESQNWRVPGEDIELKPDHCIVEWISPPKSGYPSISFPNHVNIIQHKSKNIKPYYHRFKGNGDIKLIFNDFMGDDKKEIREWNMGYQRELIKFLSARSNQVTAEHVANIIMKAANEILHLSLQKYDEDKNDDICEKLSEDANALTCDEESPAKKVDDLANVDIVALARESSKIAQVVLRAGDWIEYDSIFLESLNSVVRQVVVAIPHPDGKHLIAVENDDCLDKYKLIRKLELDSTGAPIKGSGNLTELHKCKLVPGKIKYESLQAAMKRETKEFGGFDRLNYKKEDTDPINKAVETTVKAKGGNDSKKRFQSTPDPPHPSAFVSSVESKKRKMT